MVWHKEVKFVGRRLIGGFFLLFFGKKFRNNMVHASTFFLKFPHDNT